MKKEFETPQVGDVVYLGQKKGVVTDVNGKNAFYPLEVEFDKNKYTFTKDGCMLYGIGITSLSYTPYELVGQTLQRPKELPKKGDGIWVRCIGSKTWDFRFFSHFNEKGKVKCFTDQKKEGNTAEWDEYSIERPF